MVQQYLLFALASFDYSVAKLLLCFPISSALFFLIKVSGQGPQALPT